MGLFSKTPKETPEEIYNRLVNSEATNEFLNWLLYSFSPDGDNYKFLMRDPKVNMVYLEFSRYGVAREQLVYTSRIRTLKNTFKIDRTAFGFEASGYKPLPNNSYVNIFEKIMLDELKNTFPYLVFGSFNCITIEEPAKKDW